MDYGHPGEIMAEIAALTPTFQGVTYEKIDRFGSVQWPCNETTAEAGTSLDKVVKATVFVTDLGDFAKLNAVYARRFGDHKPARSTVQVAALPRGATVEIELVVEL